MDQLLQRSINIKYREILATKLNHLFDNPVAIVRIEMLTLNLFVSLNLN